MPSSITRRGSSLVLAVAASLGTISGCGSEAEEFPETFPVTGKVSLRGEPLTKGAISFVPTNGRPATATIESDGTYHLSTFKPGDGAVPGPYRVTVSATDTDPMQMPRPGDPPPKNLVPKKYGRTATSDLNATVEKKPNEIPFDLR
ncbi:hypothetical protein ACYOEI_10955 [Singulisphaera rosea]